MSPAQFNIIYYAAFFMFGAAIGSFLNVCIYRVPRHESIVFPSSKCPSCGKHITALENIPIISYIFLLGRCSSCRQSISIRYPVVEALNALLYVCVLYRFGWGWHLPFYLAFVSSLVVITFIDLDFQIIPDVITFPGTLFGIAGGVIFLPDPFLRAEQLGWSGSLIGAAIGFGIYFLIAELSYRLLKQQGMGGGDIKFMAMVGAFLGWKAVLLTTFVGSLTGSVVGLSLIALKKRERRAMIPFGPFLALGALVSLFAGQEILYWYPRLLS